MIKLDQKHILVVRLSAMGDVAITVPIIRNLVNQYPKLKITMVSQPQYAAFFKDIPNVSFFSFYKKKKHKGILGIFKLFIELQKLKVNAIADLHNVLRSKYLRFLFKLTAKKIAFIKKNRKEQKALVRAKNKVFKPIPSIFEKHLAVFASLGYPIDLTNPLFPKKENLPPILTNLTGEKKEKWIGIAPFAQYKTKVYPLDLMEKVIVKLSEDPNNKIFLFGGGKKEVEVLKEMALKGKNIINIAGKINLEYELKLISNLDVMLSMDSGNGHIAAMLGVKVITLWGATHPFSGFIPFNQPIENSIISNRIQYPKIPTSIYGNKDILGYENVMRTILPQAIIDKIKE